MRNNLAHHNLFAVSANNMETAINTEQTLDTTMLIGIDDILNTDPRRSTNAGRATGREEPDTIYDLGKLSQVPLNYDMAQAQHFAFVLAYGLGQVSTAAAGTGYEHTITPIAGDLDAARSNPSFTGAFRYAYNVFKRRVASLFIDSFEALFEADNWVKLSAQAKGTGKIEANYTEETISAAGNATSLTLAANSVQGATAQERLDSVHRIRVELASGVWTDVAFSAVSSATPAVITITSPGGTATPVSYKVLYIPTETGWMTFPARAAETPLRVSEMTLNIGGTWNGSTFSGGRTITSELQTLKWSFNNNMAIKFVPGAGGAYASVARRGGRSQSITLDREFYEATIQRYIDANETVGVHILAQGELYDSTNHYQADILFPSVGAMKAPISAKDGRLSESAELQVLEHATYGSVIAKVKNLVATYAA
ncbi:MAG TPA: hypothetical protein PLB81_05900 [Deltaproteobacteria bacterium]|nr:hypothetical protein [Deltaproteobacteria bacterium]